MDNLYYDGVSMTFTNKIDKRRNKKEWCIVLPNPFDNDRYAEEYEILANGEKLRITYSREDFTEPIVHNHIQASQALYHQYDLSRARLNYVYIPYEEYDALTRTAWDDAVTLENYIKIKKQEKEAQNG